MDESLFRAVNALAAVPAIAALAKALSSRWMLAAVGLPLAANLAKARRWRAIVLVAAAVGVADASSARLLKPLADRARPCRALPDVRAPEGCGPGRSFPSTHAANAGALVVAAAPLVRGGWWVLLPVGLGVAGSRVVLGVHYPGDVAAGLIWGSLVGALAGWVLRRVERERAEPAS